MAIYAKLMWGLCKMYDSVLGKVLLELQTKQPAKIKTFQRIKWKEKR